MNRLTVFLLFFLGNTGLYAQADTIPPYLKCKNLVQIGIYFPCVFTAWADAFADSLSDHAGDAIQLGMRKACTGTGFPQDSIIFIHSSEWGLMKFEIWARDAAGNTSSCIVAANIFDVSGSCDPAFSMVAQTPGQKGIQDVRIDVKGSNCLGDTIPADPTQIITNSSGMYYAYGGLGTTGYTTEVIPSKKINPTNGVTTFDLIEIQKHILGNKLLDSPFKILAADANLDGKVSLLDIILLQKLLLGLIPELPHGKSWRFVPMDYAFPDPNNPFSAPQKVVVPNTADPTPSSFGFIGVKIGDVNYSADPLK